MGDALSQSNPRYPNVRVTAAVETGNHVDFPVRLPKENAVWKPQNQGTPNLRPNRREGLGIDLDQIERPLDFFQKFIAEPSRRVSYQSWIS